jgi:hypothetical protein
MIVVSFAEAARCLGIDAKTLRRPLAEAQLPLQAHPRDDRKKGVSGEHLERLAQLHQRQLISPCEQPPPPVPQASPPVPASLLTLPEQMSALQAQIAALHQQIAELTSLLHRHLPPLASPAVQTQPSRTSKRPCKPASPAPRSRPAAKTPRKPVHVIPRVEYATTGRYVVICPKKGRLPFEPDTPEWFAWVAKQESFRFVGKQGHFSAHHEWLVPNGAWRAHRQIRNHSYNLRLAPNQELTIAVLEQAAHTLQAHLA